MDILVFGRKTDKLVDIANKDKFNSYTLISEIESIEFKENKRGNIVIINENYILSDFDGVILNDTSSIYNFIWANSADIPWFHSPFCIRQAGNNNFYSLKAKSSGFLVPNGIPFYYKNSLTVKRDYPNGREISTVIYNSPSFLSIDGPYLSRQFLRNSIRFLRNVCASFGLVKIIIDDSGNYWFKSFEPVFDWDYITDDSIKNILEMVNRHCHIIKRRT